jgi:hypothetical protein
VRLRGSRKAYVATTIVAYALGTLGIERCFRVIASEENGLVMTQGYEIGSGMAIHLDRVDREETGPSGSSIILLLLRLGGYAGIFKGGS